jgi:hypothetical protein
MAPQRPSTPRGYVDSQRGRAKNRSKETGIPAGELLQLHFHRRLIARVFHGDDAANWVLKDGQALLVRWPAARYSTDIDLLSAEGTTDSAVEALKAAPALRLDDDIWFDHISTSEQSHVERPTRKVLFMAMFENARLNYKVPVDVVASGHVPRGAVTTEPLEPPFTSDCGPWPDARVFPIEGPRRREDLRNVRALPHRRQPIHAVQGPRRPRAVRAVRAESVAARRRGAPDPEG